MLALAMAALFSFAVAGTAFATHNGALLEQNAAAAAQGGAGGDAVNVAKVNQVNAAEVEQANVALLKGDENAVDQTNVVAQANLADVDQTATGGAGGDATAIAANIVAVDLGNGDAAE